ncbi:MAG: hypothetical protein IKH88_18290 [Prevotella sp.]|nr:hypothetical protein [Prevotella sp.]
MHKRINWKKGMILTDELFRDADACTMAWVRHAYAMAAVGRFGLLPSTEPFQLTLHIADGFVEVTTLSCLALTKSGELIDARFDTTYTNAYDTRVRMPERRNADVMLLAIEATDEPWRETNDGYETPCYSFIIIRTDTPVPERAVPIARLVYDDGWKMDEELFVPPCLFVKSHVWFLEQLQRLVRILRELDGKCRKAKGRTVVTAFWPVVRQLAIAADKECDTMTPMALLSKVQQCVGTFTCACALDDSLDLEDADLFDEFAMAPYNYKNAYQDIKMGLDIIQDICLKMDKLKGTERKERKEPVTELEAPAISENDLMKKIRQPKVKIPIVNIAREAVVYYTLDGTDPDANSKKGPTVILESGFRNDKSEEPPKYFTVKLMACMGGRTSKVNTFKVTLVKDSKVWLGPII